jgi:activator of HSP90 ATPase
MPTIIRQTVTFAAGPKVIYEMLMDSRKHAKFTGGAASISRRVGGRVSAYAGYATGTNIELVPNRKIVQSWRGSDWPAGHVSTVTIVLSPVRGETKLSFTQAGVPEDQFEAIRKGWKEFYWEPMRAMIRGG